LKDVIAGIKPGNDPIEVIKKILRILQKKN